MSDVKTKADAVWNDFNTTLVNTTLNANHRHSNNDWNSGTDGRLYSTCDLSKRWGFTAVIITWYNTEFVFVDKIHYALPHFLFYSITEHML